MWNVWPSRTADAKDKWHLWPGFNMITGYRPTVLTCCDDSAPPDNLNTFYSRFEGHKGCRHHPPARLFSCWPTVTRETSITSTLINLLILNQTTYQVTFWRNAQNNWRMFLQTFSNIFVTQDKVSTCLKSTIIIPVPRKPNPACLNEYRPLALTPIPVKCFERLVLQHIKSHLPSKPDPLQLPYRENRSMKDAIISTLHHLSLTHLKGRKSYARILLINFSLPFYTMLPQQPTECESRNLQLDLELSFLLLWEQNRLC